MDDPVLWRRGAQPDPVEGLGQLFVVSAAVWCVGEPAHPGGQLGEQLWRFAAPEADVAGHILNGVLHLVVQVGCADVDGCGCESRVRCSPTMSCVADLPPLHLLEVSHAEPEPVDCLGELLPVRLAQRTSGQALADRASWCGQNSGPSMSISMLAAF